MSVTPWICSQCARLFRTQTRNASFPSFRSSQTPLRYFKTTGSVGSNLSISPVLLRRARQLTQEHDDLQASIAEAYDAKSARRVGELIPTVKALKEWDQNEESYNELRALIDDTSVEPDLKVLARDDIESIEFKLPELSHALTRALIPSHPFAHLPCLIEIRPGVGGGEAALFAGDLLNMYQSYCVRKGYRTKLLQYETGEGQHDGGTGGNIVPLQEAVLEVEAEGAYGELRTEAGIHRVQRVPATETRGRVHTSVASVLVLPSIPNERSEMGEMSVDDPNSDYFVEPKDVRVDVMRARGAGGQHVNTTDSAVRLTHIPTNIVVANQTTRSQLRNREEAWRILRARVAQLKREAREEEAKKIRNSVKGINTSARSDKIRTYNFGQQRVTDHRSAISIHSLNSVIEGGESLDEVMKSVKSWMDDQDIGLLASEFQGTGT